MTFDTLPYHPFSRPRMVYDTAPVVYDDGLCRLLGGHLVSGETLNAVFPQPYFDPKRAYWNIEGRLQLMPETES